MIAGTRGTIGACIITGFGALVRQSAVGDRVLYWILGIGFVVGLAAHIGGFLLRSSTTEEPLLLVADVLYSLGFALWTGVVVAIFVQIWPDAKKCQYRQALDAYEARPARTTPDPRQLFKSCPRSGHPSNNS